MRGRTNFGDSIEDEWVIVYILRELTKKHKHIWASVVDSDGQFLLVEAAATLPAWLEPEIADNRVSLSVSDAIIILIQPIGVDSSRATSHHQTEECKKKHGYRKDQPYRIHENH